MAAIDGALDAAILGKAALGDVEIRHHLHARYHGQGEAEWRRIHFVKGAIHPIADFEFRLKGLEVDVTRPRSDGLVEDDIHILDDRGSVRFCCDGLKIEGVPLALVDGDIVAAIELGENFVDAGIFGSVVFANQILNP